MKILDRVSVILINLCLIIVFIISPALITAASPSYYKKQFEKNGVYSSIDENGTEEKTVIYYIGGNSYDEATFSDEQLDELSAHIIDYLFGDKESFALTMNGVMLNGKSTDNVNIFGDVAVSHMADVKELMTAAKVAAIISGLLLVALSVYTVMRRKTVGKTVLKYTLIFYIILIFLILVFLAVTFFEYRDIIKVNASWYLDALWTNVHHLLFPFQPEKFENSFFNDTLTEILELELFLDAMVIVFITLAAALVIWLGAAIILHRNAKKQITNVNTN